MLEREKKYSCQNSLLQNIKYQLKKFHETGTTPLRRSGSSRPPTASSKQVSNKLKRLVLNKRRHSIRNVAPKFNSKNDIIWSTSRQDADKHGGYFGREKFSPGIMLWGAIRYQWPKRAKKTMNGTRYADRIRTIAYPAIMQQYRNQIPIFQDDAARIHRTQAVLQQIDALFNERIPVAVQSPKFDDVWAIEIVWGIIREKLLDMKYLNINQLESQIKKIWQSISSQQCQSIISSMVRRTSLLTKNGGQRLTHDDYRCL
ncbi:unnamed protein product [Rotaria sordida]|uniref:Uncharacterized protein n=1 Tax=Rotaria sordida TaxID=392033 RepID=A0A819KAK9_9BILA|nr:unnamed protein product [Rotaria sordida]